MKPCLIHSWIAALVFVMTGPMAVAGTGAYRATAMEWRAEVAQAAAGSISPQRAAEIVQQRVGGRVLAVDRLRQDARQVYRVKILSTDGEIRVYRVDAETGALR
jgi:uncharacterized membrane protein YkoI